MHFRSSGHFLGLCAFVCLFGAGSVLANDDLIIRDDFSNGEVATPLHSSANTSWVVENGSFSVDGTKLGENHRPVGGELNFGVDEPAQIHIDFGDVAESTPLTIRFTLSSSSEGLANNVFDVELWNVQSGEFYVVRMTGNAAYYGEVDGPKSGFHGYTQNGDHTAGTAGMRLEAGQPMAMEITFDDLTGGVLTMDGEIASKWPNFKNLSKIDRIVFRSEGHISWYLTEFEVEGALREK